MEPINHSKSDESTYPLSRFPALRTPFQLSRLPFLRTDQDTLPTTEATVTTSSVCHPPFSPFSSFPHSSFTTSHIITSTQTRRHKQPFNVTTVTMVTLPTLPEALYCVIGWPLAQTLSPLLHTTGFQTLAIPAVYLKFAIERHNLPTFMQSVRILPIAGCSVTIPHKTAVIEYIDSISDRAKSAGAVNTLYWEGNKLVGDNTDISGFLAPLTNIDLPNMRILILGSGGAARAVLGGLRLRQARSIALTTPSNKSHLPLAEEFNVTPLAWEERYRESFDLIINATPLGMRGNLVNQTPYDFSQAQKQPYLVYDIVYNPLETLFLREAKEHGIQGISGRDMFFEQGNAQFLLWTGKNLPNVAKEALDHALSA